jgi:hypothetical protein
MKTLILMLVGFLSFFFVSSQSDLSQPTDWVWSLVLVGKMSINYSLK